MKVYRLNISAPEDAGEGENHDEWFGSLRAARQRRAALIAADPTLSGCRYPSDYQIDVVEVRALPKRDLVLALLNRRGCFDGAKVVVDEYVPRQRQDK